MRMWPPDADLGEPQIVFRVLLPPHEESNRKLPLFGDLRAGAGAASLPAARADGSRRNAEMSAGIGAILFPMFRARPLIREIAIQKTG
jgi:hypothetical protein